jgi:hypothetical protein
MIDLWQQEINSIMWHLDLSKSCNQRRRINDLCLWAWNMLVSSMWMRGEKSLISCINISI